MDEPGVGGVETPTSGVVLIRSLDGEELEEESNADKRKRRRRRICKISEY